MGIAWGAILVLMTMAIVCAVLTIMSKSRLLTKPKYSSTKTKTPLIIIQWGLFNSFVDLQPICRFGTELKKGEPWRSPNLVDPCQSDFRHFVSQAETTRASGGGRTGLL